MDLKEVNRFSELPCILKDLSCCIQITVKPYRPDTKGSTSIGDMFSFSDGEAEHYRAISVMVLQI